MASVARGGIISSLQTLSIIIHQVFSTLSRDSTSFKKTAAMSSKKIFQLVGSVTYESVKLKNGVKGAKWAENVLSKQLTKLKSELK